MWTRGRITPRVRESKEQAGAKFSDYFDFAEPFTRLPSHRALAMFRGEREEVLDLTVQPEPEEEAPPPRTAPARTGPSGYEQRIAQRFGISDRGRAADRWLAETVRSAW